MNAVLQLSQASHTSTLCLLLTTLRQSQLVGAPDQSGKLLVVRIAPPVPLGPARQAREAPSVSWWQSPSNMGRMHSNGKGMSSSALPYKRTPPSWLKTNDKEVSGSPGDGPAAPLGAMAQGRHMILATRRISSAAPALPLAAVSSSHLGGLPLVRRRHASLWELGELQPTPRVGLPWH